MNALHNAVIVGVATSGFEAAVTFAVEEARRTSRPLHLVHVLQIPAGDAYVGVYGGALEDAHSLLEGARAYAARLAATDVVVSAELVDHGWIVDDLVRRTDSASLIVLQHRAMARAKRVFVGSIAHGVAGRAHVPVVSVPEGWTPAAAQNGLVTAAVQDPVEASAVLRTGFEEARVRDAELLVLHAWWLASGFDVAVVDNAMREDWTARTHDELEPVLAPLRTEFPDVKVSVRVQHAPPAEAVLDAAERSDLLVLGRRHHLLPLHSHLGPVARAALNHASCPVLITPEHALEPSKTPAREPAARRAAGH
jgi:nucleotide-binding universal stress UspA family protein